MRIVLAIDSFKGCLSSVEVESSVEKGVKLSCPQAEVEKIPVSDGGDGMLEVFSQLVGCEKVTVACHDALMRPIQAEYAISPSGVVVLETAVACGINLLKSEELNPLRATSYGVGEVIADALLRGYHSYIIGLGGSATSDCGLGMLVALKRKLGEDWQNKLPKDLDIILASDVANPLFGDTGAAVVFGPQEDYLKTKMVDGLLYTDQVKQLIKKELGIENSEDISQVTVADPPPELIRITTAFIFLSSDNFSKSLQTFCASIVWFWAKRPSTVPSTISP